MEFVLVLSGNLFKLISRRIQLLSQRCENIINQIIESYLAFKNCGIEFLDLVDNHGITPLLAAIWERHIEVCEFLVSKGAKKDGLVPSGVTYLESTDVKEIKELLK